MLRFSGRASGHSERGKVTVYLNQEPARDSANPVSWEDDDGQEGHGESKQNVLTVSRCDSPGCTQEKEND